MGCRASAKRAKPAHGNRTKAALIMPWEDYENLLEIVDEIGDEMGRFREDLLAHQNKVRRIMVDVGGMSHRC